MSQSTALNCSGQFFFEVKPTKLQCQTFYMQINTINLNGVSVAEIVSENIIINEAQDALDLMADCRYSGNDGIIMYESQIIPEFFDLKTGIAGEILQKFSTYDMQLAIIGDFSKYTSKSLHDFIYESNKAGRISFVGSLNEAREKISIRK